MLCESRARAESARIHAAAVYCSDGRVGEHLVDFLRSGRDVPRDHRVSLHEAPPTSL